ncbi:Small glutamine-rich tetratricopeptide repeat-containing protein 2 [Rhodotorula toruloides]
MASATAQKRAAFAVLQFLEDSLKNGSIKEDDKEGIEVASQCIAEAFGVSGESDQDRRAYGLSKPLAQLLDEAAAQTSTDALPKEASAEDKQAADAAKSRGNQLMAKKDYPGAIEAYSEAIKKDASNPVYWSNRAAAYSQVQDHKSAVSDAREALKIDPSFSKAYSRLGHALFSIGEYQEAVEAYEKGLELDPTNATMKSSLSTARARLPASSTPSEPAASADSVSSRSGAGAGAGAGLGAGGIPGFPGMGAGMPDLASLMSNPALMGMAQQLMQNGGLERMMQNPMMQRMMESMGGGGGGMPDMSQLMNDPEMRRMAESFGSAMGGGAGGAGGRGGQQGGSNNSDMYS